MIKKKASKIIARKPCVAGVITGGIDERIVKKAISEGAGALELRIDTFNNITPVVLIKACERLGKNPFTRNMPLILTIRSNKEGGKNTFSDAKRLELFSVLMPYADFVDVELSSSVIIKNVINCAKKHGKKVIVSYHNFKSTPQARLLEDIILRSRKAGADIVKVATAVKRWQNLNTLAGLLINEKNLVVIGMGPGGMLSRVFFPMLGSAFTYGSVGDATAPGQLMVREIKAQWKACGFS
ncbi:type I 3-dehydroquinate dehydratase [bacterium]|nr:MAG: type I 3-dehydroquinate dehydratase [bacterium]